MSRARPTAYSCHRLALCWVLCAWAALAAAGCQSGGPKQSEDHRHVEQIIEAVEALRAAYAERDLKAMQALRAPSQDLDALLRGAERDFAAYAAIEFTMTIERLAIQDAQTTVNVRWEGVWRHTSDAAEDTALTDRGHGALVWSDREGDGVRLEQASGNLPFGIADR